MNNYRVYVPFTGYYFLEMEAENEADAVNKAIELNPMFDAYGLTIDDGAGALDFEWKPVRQVVIKDVFYGELNQAWATLAETQPS